MADGLCRHWWERGIGGAVEEPPTERDKERTVGNRWRIR